MNVKIDIENLISSKFNDAMLSNNDEVMKVLIKTANKYGHYGMEALKFWTDILNTLSMASKLKSNDAGDTND